MIHGLATLSSPSDLDALQSNLVELALGGAITPESGVRSWLESMAVVRAGDAEAVVADEDWLACTLPSPRAEDLLVRTLLRDPLYRLHVDVALAAVIVAVGVSGRWPRLEELLFGDLKVTAPRLAALIELVRADEGSWNEATWRRLDPVPTGLACLLDARCWGLAGSPDELFPVLRTRYPAFAAVPVMVVSPSQLVSTVVSAATTGEAVRVPVSQQSEVHQLARQGVPLWWRPMADGQIEVTLSTPCRARGTTAGASTYSYSLGTAAHVRDRSALLVSAPAPARTSLWKVVEDAAVGLAFVGASRHDDWPADELAILRGLPSSRHLGELVRVRQSARGSIDPADDALRALADHPLYGFWIQVLLIEALDRELGEETILFAPPTHAIVRDVEAATRVYYRPRAQGTQEVQRLLELGSLDDVMTRVSTSVSIHPVGALGDAAGPWSTSLALLTRVGIVQTRHDRWSLTTHTLDRLHGGGLMTGVIRRGRDFRERLHEVLEALWRLCIVSSREMRRA